MKDFATTSMRPIGYFVHHQGRGHAQRCAAIVRALPRSRPVTIFCARGDIFGPLPDHVEVRRIPSLFEPSGAEQSGMAALPTPDTLHCAPVGWPSVREAMSTLAEWFGAADPALLISDVSAEVAQLARLCSVPHVCVMQHGDRSDPGHMSAYRGASGLLAPFAEALAQPDWDGEMRRKMHFAGGLGVSALPSRDAARAALGIAADTHLALCLSGGGGSGFAQAPFGVAARTFPEMEWVTIGRIERNWHATDPGNIRHLGWVDNAEMWIAAADLIVSSAGNSTCAQVAASGVPWVVVPEWRYFDEQVEKARALSRLGAAHHLAHLPSSAQAWRRAVAEATEAHDTTVQRALIDPAPARETARWIENLIARLWEEPALTTDTERTIA
ncbi:hypothetical protein OCH239_11970 [Roseivivax halodurans JCM 10272]|uniref:Glycosyl transferase family 28 C-terminal domain-containing protein n=1 Tax=Roseivivax halodurans JCM 10272 TaxID=1449350 RepID=X7EJ58_9RHOB|nr:glycosyltransferase [Roseivivax halodurans]ETX15885.1 hypothetical protein OCH239_11970 [Roseivivax halodurans JCM 10272]